MVLEIHNTCSGLVHVVTPYIVDFNVSSDTKLIPGVTCVTSIKTKTVQTRWDETVCLILVSFLWDFFLHKGHLDSRRSLTREV